MEIKQKTACVIGAGGFIGHNLVKRLKSEGWEVTGVDLKFPLYEESPADDFFALDARVLNWEWNRFDRVYQLAAQMGGAGYVFTGDNDAEILSDSLSINIHVLKELKKAEYKGKIFYSSSVCAYPDDVAGHESDAYPANPPSNYGWEKLTSERLFLSYAKNYGLDVRIARFHNCFGPYGTYEGGREKAPAAVCRKVAQAEGEIEIWGDGEQLRPFIFIEDLLDGIEKLMQSNYTLPVNLGPDSGITINQLVDAVCGIAGKILSKRYIKGPIGGQHRHANNYTAQEVLKWEPRWELGDALKITYEWIKGELDQKK